MRHHTHGLDKGPSETDTDTSKSCIHAAASYLETHGHEDIVPLAYYMLETKNIVHAWYRAWLVLSSSDVDLGLTWLLLPWNQIFWTRLRPYLCTRDRTNTNAYKV